jgi:hypothetical protein
MGIALMKRLRTKNWTLPKERKHLYKEYADQLINSAWALLCF